MEETARVDRQGRVVLPSALRMKPRLSPNGTTESIRLDGDRIVLEAVNEDLDRKAADWRKTVMELHAKPFTEKIEESWKWSSVEYARRKLGLR